MAGLKLCLLIIGAVANVLDAKTLGDAMQGKVVVCYVASWASYFPDSGKFDIDDLDPSMCSHLVYSFGGLDEATMSIKSLDPWQDMEKWNGQAGFKGFVALKQQHPNLKVTRSIGGWLEGSLKFSKMAASRENRRKFIQSVLTFLELYKFDGLDLDWEFPAQRDGRPEDKANFVTLLRELKQAFEPHNYTLTATVNGVKEIMDAAYDLPKLGRYLDLIHMVCYDYHGAWNGVVGANAPLKSSREFDHLSVEYTIKYMLEQGLSPSKMVLGLPLYGRTFILQNPDVEKVEFGRTAVKSQGFRGPYTKEDGYMTLNEICLELSNQTNSWTRHWDHVSSTPYLRDKDRVISYDDAQSIALKVKMAISYNLGGVMLWRMDTDDFKGACATLTNTYTRGSSVLKEALKTTTLPPGKAVVCYVASWATYRVEAAKYDIDDLEPGHCTHLIYSFARLDEATMSIKSMDPWQDIQKWNGQAGYKGFVAMKQRYPDLKVTLSIGGWLEGSLKFSKMAASRQNRRTFIQSVVTYLDTYKFDGLDLDWEYPARRDGRPEDKANYVSLVKELKAAFEPHKYILTAAIAGNKETMEVAYDLPKLTRYLDLLHMVCYDYHGAWDGVVGANAPLRAGKHDVLSVENTIKYMLERGVSPNKMVLGLPMYGRTFILQDPDVEKIEFRKTPVKPQGFKGPYTKEADFMGYNEICLELSNKSNSWRRHWDELSSTPYIRDRERVVSYDDAQSIALKIEMAMSYNLGGVMLWRIDTDDFKGACAAMDRADVHNGSVLKEVYKFSADSSRTASAKVLSAV
ncbi:probable chitinase 10 [Choristoneura fumiferana]|uniref:probable chitinase 10 n=1 Tax=Choristoneura fumiferana TaxID=7141 RepID=UPI003D1557D5